jgi:sensor histidine kinase YesM
VDYPDNAYFVGMSKLFLNATNKYLRIELGFLFFISFVITLISDLEYSAFEQQNILKFSEDIDYRFVCGTFSFLVYGALYWGFLKHYVLKKNIVGIILCLLGFFLIYRLADHYILNWVIVHLDFISAEIRTRTLEDMNSQRMHFAISYLLISAIFPLLGLAFLVRTLHQNEEMSVIKEQQLYSELNYLKAQLHPHFFFNTLNNIYALALKQSVDTAPIVAKLGEMMRYILYEAAQPVVSLLREIEFISNYVAVERIRHQQNVTIDFDVQGLDNTYQIEPLLILPFVENAFKHGLEQELGNGHVHIVICQTENELLLEVTNSKPKATLIDTKKGIGISNVVRRLDLLYPNKYQLTTNDEEKQYRIILSLQSKI